MVESLKELNRICQKPHYKTKGNWMVRHILRDAALPITWLLLHTSVTANQVTLASLVIGLAGIGFLAVPSSGYFVFGVILLQLWYLLDHVDGQIARYRKKASMTGRFYDFLIHHIIHGVIFFALGIYGYNVTGRFLFVLWGFLTSMAMMSFNLLEDVKAKTFYERFLSAKMFRVIPEDHPSGREAEEKSSRLTGRRIFSLLHKAVEIHVLMNILTLLCSFEIFSPAFAQARFYFFLLYGLAVPVTAAVKASFIISRQKIDSSFNDKFQILE